MSRIVLKKNKFIGYYLDINKLYLIEENLITNHSFRYDLSSDSDKKFFQQRLKFNARCGYATRLDSYLLYYLHFLHWL